MATATTDDIAAIRRQMAKIRRELHEDAQAVREKAEEATDWRRYLRSYPLAALGIAFAVGFLVVPRKRRSVTRTAEKAAEAAVARVQEVGNLGLVAPAAKEKEKKRGLIGWAIGLIAPVAIRAAQGYALKYVETMMAQQGGLGPLAGLLQGGPPPPSGPGPGPAGPNPNVRRPG